MMRFFTEKVMQPRFPKTIVEGTIKGLMLGGMIFGSYEALSPIPKTIDEQVANGQMILTGYALLILLGTLCGLVGQCYLNDNQQEVPQLRR